MHTPFCRFPLAAAAVSCLLLPPHSTTAQSRPPKEEVRAVWLTTASGLDWPRTTGRAEQIASLKSIVRTLRSMNFNTICFQVRARGDAYYRSRYEPWADNLTGTLGKDPGWDPLQTILDEAHAAGMEVHAWFNVFKIRGPSTPRSAGLPHPAAAYPSWVVEADGEGWFDPGIPAARDYLVDVALDLARSYDIDAINFDFVRYPGREFQDAQTYRRYGGTQPRDDWRRANVTAFIRAFHERIIAEKPWLKIGSSPLGVYSPDPASGSGGSYASVFQDSKGWLSSHIHDFLSPQIYWDIGASRGDPDFEALAQSWGAAASGRHIYAGIAPYKPAVLAQLERQIDVARSAGLQGQIFFRLEHILNRSAFAGRYDLPALIPPMRWKDATPPMPPGTLAVTEIATNVFQLEWAGSPRAADGDSARWYVVYRSSSPDASPEGPEAIVCVLPSGTTSFVDSIRTPTGPTYYYAVAARDRAQNESTPSGVTSGVIRELLAMNQRVADITSVSASLDPKTGAPSLVAYRLARTAPVLLDIVESGSASTTRPVAILVEGVQDGGIYVVGVEDIALRPGAYTLRLRTGGNVVEQEIQIRP